ncbi:sigma-54 interaction domain-containing protein [Falsibacillus albus]|uniref:PAS domain S-box protein n=1 Tax=Falsibacillus albus TaxID=2478915 RepID=A0A3L7K1K4_9BACI|nr:sigma 54-interacting transcriptional regulator [Falsibacillus albus]RLQ96485.1 PAS domain S-box protein [Falsibacillus albus]
MKEDHARLIQIYEKVVNSIDAGVHVIDEDGKTVIYNEKMRKIEGMEIQDVLDKKLLEVFQFHQWEDSTLLKVLKSGEPILNIKQTYFNNKGEEITTINNTFPIIENGKMIGAMEIARDVSKLEKIMRENVVKNGDAVYSFESILGCSDEIRQAIETSKRAAGVASPVLLIGETGTGKELFAQSIHQESSRSRHPFLGLNCAGMTKDLLEQVLFGSIQAEGSPERPGIFEQADGGTVLLEDIHTLPISIQEKVLKVILEKNVCRVGDTLDRHVDVRVLASMNEDPIDAIADGKLRKDLYYRLSAVSIFIPSLRERNKDILLMTDYFIDKFNQLLGLKVSGVSREVQERFEQYDWPGNVRELEHVIEGAMNLMEFKGEISYNHLPLYFRQKLEHDYNPDLLYQSEREIKPLDLYMQDAEIYYIQKALIHHDFNITKTAKALGMSRQNLQYRIRKYEIERQE